jgi:hypothetical protein
MTVADKLDGLSVLTRSCQALTGLHICQFFLVAVPLGSKKLATTPA